MNVKVTSKGGLDMGKKLDGLNKLIKDKTLRDELADIAYKHFIEGFPTSSSDMGGGQTDASIGGWEVRKEDYNHPTFHAKTGRIEKSIKVKNGTISTNLPMAVGHNEGGGWLPKREFIGPSADLVKKSVKYLLDRISKLLKS